MVLRVNKKLNLVIPIETPGSSDKMYVYASPISLETFERFYLPIAQVWDTIYSRGLRIGGVPIAMAALQDAARRAGMWEIDPESPEAEKMKMFTVKDGLLVEIRRLAILYVPTPGGPQPMTLADAQKAGVLDAEDVREVENALAFFTILFHMHTRDVREEIMKEIFRVWNASIVSSSFTDYLASLPTATKDANIGEKGAEEPPKGMSYVPS